MQALVLGKDLLTGQGLVNPIHIVCLNACVRAINNSKFGIKNHYRVTWKDYS